MKKLLWLLILIPAFMTRAFANDVYYSEYSDFSDYQEQFIVETDMVDVEEVTMYKWYKMIQIEGDYKLYNSTDNFNNNCYETDYSNWSNIKPNMTEATILEEKTIYNYQMVKPIRYIHLYDFVGSYSAIRIPELQVFYDDKEIDYTYTCNGCWEGFGDYIHNGIYAENKSYIDNGGNLVIDLGREYPINKVKLLFYIYDMVENDKKFTLGYSKDGSNIFIKQSFVENFSNYYFADAEKFEYMVNDLNVSNDLWLYDNTSEQYIDNEFVYNRTSYKQYRYKEKYCQTYTLAKEYYPQYSIYAVDNYNLKESPKTFYRYRTRDKLELNLYDITEKNYDLSNFVIYSSDDYNITNNINWDKNGVYQANFNMNNLNITKDVKVNILSNAIEEKNEEIEDLKNQLNSTIHDYEQIISNLENTNSVYLESLNNLNLEIIDLNNKIQKLESDNVIQDEELQKLQDELNEKLNLYEEKINSLEKLNQQYLENLTILSNNIYDLQQQLSSLESNNISQTEELKQKLNNHINEYEEKIKYLEEFNNDYITKLEEINYNISDIYEKLNILDEKSNNIYTELSARIIDNNHNIVYLKQIVEQHLTDFKNLNYEVFQIKEYLKSMESNNDKVHEELLDKIEETTEQRIEAINKLNEEILRLEQQIAELKNSEVVQDEVLEQLQIDLNNVINNYQAKIKELQDVNVNYTNDLQDINYKILQLEEQIINMSNVQDNSNLQINDLKSKLEYYVETYNSKFSHLEEINTTYLQNLKAIDVKIQDVVEQIQSIELINSDKFKELDILVNNNSEQLLEVEDSVKKSLEDYKILTSDLLELDNKISDIENTINEKYDNVLNNQNSMSNKLDNYEIIIENLDSTNKDYLIQIELFKDEIEKLKLEISKLKTSNDSNYKNIMNGQDLIYEKIIENNNQILEVKTSQLNDNKDIENLKQEVAYISETIEKKNDVDLNEKLNNYMLKINGVEVISLVPLYILIAILFVIYVIYLFKKKSNKNNS